MAGACHAALFRFLLDHHGLGWTHCVVLVDSAVANAPGVETFIQWLVTKSMWADAFEEKDFDTIKEFGFLIDLTQKQSVVGGALQLSRTTTNEFRESLQSLGAVLECGFEIPTMVLASLFLSSGNLQISKEKRVEATAGSMITKQGPSGTNHLPFPSLTWEGLVYLAHNQDLKFSEKEHKFTSVPSMNGLSAKLEKLCQGTIKGAKSGGVDFSAIFQGEATVLGQQPLMEAPIEYTSPWGEGTLKALRAFCNEDPGSRGKLGVNLLALELLIEQSTTKGA